MQGGCTSGVSISTSAIYYLPKFLLVESTEVRNFADDNPVFESEKDLNSLINRLEHDSLLAIEWFEKTIWSWIKKNIIY